MKIVIDEYIYLKLFDLSLCDQFYDSIHQLNNSSDVFRQRLQKKYPTFDKLAVSIKDAVENKYRVDGTPDFFIFYKNQLAGVFEFAPLVADVDFLEVGYWLYLEHHRQGIMSNVMKRMIAFAKENFDRPRLIATTPIENLPSRALLESCGFKNTGITEVIEKDHGEKEEDIEYEYLLFIT